MTDTTDSGTISSRANLSLGLGVLALDLTEPVPGSCGHGPI